MFQLLEIIIVLGEILCHLQQVIECSWGILLQIKDLFCIVNLIKNVSLDRHDYLVLAILFIVNLFLIKSFEQFLVNFIKILGFIRSDHLLQFLSVQLLYHRILMPHQLHRVKLVQLRFLRRISGCVQDILTLVAKQEFLFLT